MRFLLLCFCFFVASSSWSQQKYESFKEKLLENLNSSRTTAQLAHAELSGFTRQETIQYYGEMLQKEVDAQLVEVALSYYQNLPEESATHLLESLCFHPQFGNRALKALLAKNASAFLLFAQVLMTQDSFLNYPYRSTLYSLLSQFSDPNTTLLLQKAFPKDITHQTLLLRELGKNSQNLSFVFQFLKEQPVPVLEALSRFGSQEELLVALDFVTHTAMDVKLAAIQALGSLKSKASYDALFSLLKDPSWIIRRNALQALKAHFSESQEIAPLILHFGSDSENRFVTIELILVSTPVSFQTVETLLMLATPEEQRFLFLQLREAKMEENENWLPLVWSFLERNPSLEWLSILLPLCSAFPTAQWLSDFPERQLLLKKLIQEEHVLSQIEVVRMIGHCGIRFYAPQLTSLLNASSVALQCEVANTLGKLGVPTTLTPLLEKIRESDLSEVLRFELQLAILRVQKER